MIDFSLKLHNSLFTIIMMENILFMYSILESLANNNNVHKESE